MVDQVSIQSEEQTTFWDKHRLWLLLVAVIVIAITMTVISMFAYNASGTAQLDLSRPGYSSISDQVDKTDKITEYSAFGSVNKDSLNEFTKLYDEQASKAKTVDAFNGDPLNPEVLEFATPSVGE